MNYLFENSLAAMRAQEEEAERWRAAREEQDRLQALYRLRYNDNPSLFLQTEGLFCRDLEGSITSQELYAIYKDWCILEELPLSSPREFWQRIKGIAPYYQLSYSGQVLDSRGKRVRGFRGIRPLTPEEA